MSEPRRSISPERSFAYYLGMVLVGVGFILFLSPMCSAFSSTRRSPSQGSPFMSPSELSDFQRGAHSEISEMQQEGDSAFSRAIVGFVLFGIGGVLMAIGRSGFAGSGVVLDPQQAREDMEPWSRATGGMIADALEEIPALQRTDPEPKEVIRVRCLKCGHLNNDTAKFCEECGESLTRPSSA